MWEDSSGVLRRTGDFREFRGFRGIWECASVGGRGGPWGPKTPHNNFQDYYCGGFGGPF